MVPNPFWAKIHTCLKYITVIQVLVNADLDLLRPRGYKRVYLPFCKVTETPFHIQSDLLSTD